MSETVTVSGVGNPGDLKDIRGTTAVPISANDAANPEVASGKGFSRYKKVELEIIVGGTTPTWDITSLLINDDGDAYMEGDTITMTGAKTFVQTLEVNGNTDVNFRVDGKTGTSPTIIIKGRGLNN